MSRSQPTNLSASVLQRLLTVSKSLQEDFTLTLTRYAIERFLYRLSRSPFADRFVLKGAMLMNVWAKQPFRRTRDLDLLGYGEPSAAHLREVFAELCALQVEPDGLIFDPTTIRIEAIRDDQEYQGERVRVILSANAAWCCSTGTSGGRSWRFRLTTRPIAAPARPSRTFCGRCHPGIPTWRRRRSRIRTSSTSLARLIRAARPELRRSGALRPLLVSTRR